MHKAFEEIRSYVEGLEVIDTHEHLFAFEKDRDMHTDVLKEYLLHYFNRDLVSAGLPPADLEKVMNPDLPLMDRWDLVEPFWQDARNTGYGRALDLTAKGLYDIDGVNRSTIEALNEAFLQSLKPGHYQKVLKDKCKIRTSLLTCCGESDQTFFRNMYFTDNLIFPQTKGFVQSLERESGVSIRSMQDWLDACDAAIEKSLERGAVGLKSGLAYRRAIRYERVTWNNAEQGFLNIYRNENFPDWMPQTFTIGKDFQDYVMHHILRFADKRGLPFQFHTGIQEGNGNVISNSDPALLCNLFLEYPDVRFDVFHIGYPYQNVLAALGKMFPNVFVDMCWAHIISPTASVNALSEWLDAMPANKISAFGGDYRMVDTVYGHLQMAKANVSKSLARKVKEGVFDVDRAKQVAKMLFFDNPMRIFKLEGKI